MVVSPDASYLRHRRRNTVATAMNGIQFHVIKFTILKPFCRYTYRCVLTREWKAVDIKYPSPAG
jgi:hypothetical protein